MSTHTDPVELECWLDTPLGRYVATREQAAFDSIVADVFGFNALQFGLSRLDFLASSRMPFKCRVDREGAVGLRADFRDLPIATGSVDLVLLPHVLEFSDDPHQILREVVRILMPEGQVIISGFNPWSMWGARRVLSRAPVGFPWGGRFINLPRLKDWLSLLSFEVSGGRMGCYVPPFAQDKWLRRCDFMEDAGDRWWPFMGGVYFLQAVKRVRGMRMIMPKWTDLRAAQKSLAPIAQNAGRGRVAARAGSATRGRLSRAQLTVLPGGRNWNAAGE
jgi:SAM-dependent methyltransferase